MNGEAQSIPTKSIKTLMQPLNSIMPVIILCISGALFYPLFLELYDHLHKAAEASSALLIPVFSIYFVWMQRQRLRGILSRSPDVSFSKSGLALLLSGLMMFIIGKFTDVLIAQGAAFIVIVAAGILFLFGKELFKATLAPVLFMLFILPIPSPVYSGIAEQLKYVIADFSTAILSSLNIPVFQDGTVINLPSGSLLVHETCSGIQTTVSIIIISSGFAYLFLKSYLYRIAFIVIAMPIGIAVNVLRVTAIGILSYLFNMDFAMNFHSHAWVLVTPLGVTAVFAIGWILRWFERRNIL